MSPDELHRELVEAARQWREDERARRPEAREAPAGFRLVWVDTGSGPGFEALAPRTDET